MMNNKTRMAEKILEKISEKISSCGNQYIEFLSQLVQTDTQVIGHGVDGGKEQAGQEIVKARLSRLGLSIDEFPVEDDKIRKYPGANLGHNNEGRNNIVGVMKGIGGGRSLILNGHIDTMPFGDRQAWSKDPFSGMIEGDKLYGLGSTDMKASLSAMIMALEVIKSCDIKLKGDLILQSVVDEEGGGNGTLACVERGYKADAAIVGEPTHLNIQPAHMGFMFHEIKVSGLSIHSSQLWNGVNAIDKAMKIYKSLQELEHYWLMTERHPLLPPPTINLGVIEGGIAGSVVPGSCTMKTCLHYHPKSGQSFEETRNIVNEQVQRAIMNTAQADPWLAEHPPEITVYQEGFPFETDVNHPVVEEMSNIIHSLFNKEAIIEGMPAGCDARLLSQFGSTPTIIVGCGDAKQAHTVDEYVSVSEYLKCIEVYANFIVSWCGIDSQ
ncbi:ArgE/DapE family deacylase [Paenibacillus sabinae]|uniref:Acetylornithine deacetylase or succinyl-diaminopimelate desuccinylase n=1 Tax=Paenibacillus sabinae T27 TaxID=1268072 RepID=X4ZLT9_9BACL|nr:ArgE/DapE family deacylase [Paenibacillus sabinae]AHV97650.1 acetylornithine deacetylase or succinyl- diaminopimelate desuccinylase [Paenibacillus sabinae T27]